MFLCLSVEFISQLIICQNLALCWTDCLCSTLFECRPNTESEVGQLGQVGPFHPFPQQRSVPPATSCPRKLSHGITKYIAKYITIISINSIILPSIENIGNLPNRPNELQRVECVEYRIIVLHNAAFDCRLSSSSSGRENFWKFVLSTYGVKSLTGALEAMAPKDIQRLQGG